MSHLSHFARLNAQFTIQPLQIPTQRRKKTLDGYPTLRLRMRSHKASQSVLTWG